ncbi:hypothetical protein L0128_00845 [candidate division KSB1 bacterium]|nr:hypothetical protein [candidate division KSB1 bacterium]
MRKIIGLIFILAAGWLLQCARNPLNHEPGSIGLQLIWPTAESNLLTKLKVTTGEPTAVKVTLNPGAKVFNFTYSAHTGQIDDLAPGDYSIQVQAFDAGNYITHQGSNSSVKVESGQVTAVTIKMESLAPTNVQASKNYEEYIKVTWDAVSQATNYKVYRDTSSTGAYALVTTTTSRSWNDETADPARFYYYFVVAVLPVGESSGSAWAQGYRKGWRFDQISLYDPSDGIGFNFDLYAYGFLKNEKTAILYAIYTTDEVNYYFAPGSGDFGFAAYSVKFSPGYEATRWNNHALYLYNTTWDSNYRNNNYQHYICCKIYKNNSVSSLNDPYYATTDYFQFYWVMAADGTPHLKLLKRLSPAESEHIQQNLKSPVVTRPSAAPKVTTPAGGSDFQVSDGNQQNRDL